MISAHLAVTSTGIGAASGAGDAIFSWEVLNITPNLAVTGAGITGAAGAGVAVLGRNHQRVGLGDQSSRKERERPAHKRETAY